RHGPHCSMVTRNGGMGLKRRAANMAACTTPTPPSATMSSAYPSFPLPNVRTGWSASFLPVHLAAIGLERAARLLGFQPLHLAHAVDPALRALLRFHQRLLNQFRQPVA